ncbi:PadR family transcriptional regulator [Agrococcus sp. 1P02AA]|uniref:PadR family transcriptional regulator n=1 Tax=Agrococcus sp. 1P02AA TaxID=3132259 RepID=UPI0039A4B9E9
MQFVILGMLLGGPLSLYDVQRHFERIVSLFYSASAGSIQRALRQLAADGRVVVDAAAVAARGRKPYRITDAGREAWREWMLTPPTGSELETAMLARVFFLGRLEAPEDRLRVIDGILMRLRAEDDRLASLAGTMPSAASPEALLDPLLRPQLATLEYGRRSLALALDWVSELAEAEGTR